MTKQNKTDMKKDEGGSMVEAQVLQMISDKKIKVKPKWHFFVNEAIFWVLCVSLVVIASLALSVFIYTLFDSNDAVALQSGGVFSYLVYFIDLLFWLTIFLAVAVLAYFDFIKTKYGYRQFFQVTYIVIAVYILLGVVFYFTNTFEYVDRFFINEVPYYHEVSNTKLSVWSRSEDGLLGGEILEIEGIKACTDLGAVPSTSTTKITLLDFHGGVWVIKTDDAKWHTEDCLKFSDKIKISGSIAESGIFKAANIWGW